MRTRLCRLSPSGASLVLFLKYDPKDVIIVIGGLIFGPLTSLLFPLDRICGSDVYDQRTGILGCIMNIISSCSSPVPLLSSTKEAQAVRCHIRSDLRRMLPGCGHAAVELSDRAGLYGIYKAVAELASRLLPFNLIKGGLNAAATLLLYKPVITALAASESDLNQPAAPEKPGSTSALY